MARKGDMTQPWFTEIDALYRRILFRPVDPSGYKTYSAQLIAAHASLDDIARILSNSEECRQVTEARERATRFRRDAERRAGSLGPAGASPAPPQKLSSGRTAPILADPAFGPGLRDEGLDDACFLHVGRTPLHKLQTPDSVLFDPDLCAPAHSVNPSERRYATCSDAAWFHGDYLAVVNMLGNTLIVYRFEPADASLHLLQTLSESMHLPVCIAVAPDESFLAISQTGGKGKITLHAIDPETHTVDPVGRLIAVEPEEMPLHGVQITPDGRFVVITCIGDAATVTVIEIATLKRTCRVRIGVDPLKPKSVGFTPDGHHAVIAHGCNAGRIHPSSGALTLHAFDPVSGLLQPEPLQALDERDCELFDTPEILDVLPDGRRILMSNQVGEFLSVFHLRGGRLVPERRVLIDSSVCFPHGVRASRDGRFLAVTNHGDDTVQVHALNRLDVRIVLLGSDPERVAHVEGVLAPDLVAQGIVEPRLVEAFDGESLDDVRRLTEALGLDGETFGCGTSVFMRRKLACLASHVRAWGSMRDGVPAMVLEDDAVLAGDALERAARIVIEADQLYPGWHLIQLYSNCCIDASGSAGVLPYGAAMDDHHGNVGYVISPLGAATLSALFKQRCREFSATDLRKQQSEPHFGHDLTIMQWARTGACKVLWSTDRLVETIGQIGPLHQAGELHSRIYSGP